MLNEVRGLNRPFDEYGLPTLSLASLPQNVLSLQNPAEFLCEFRFHEFKFYCIQSVKLHFIYLMFFIRFNEIAASSVPVAVSNDLEVPVNRM